MTTADTLVSSALREITSLAPGEAIPGAESEFALSVLNSMLAGWGAAGLMTPARTLENFSISAGVSSRTIGSGAQLNTTRPDFIHDAYLRDSGGNDFPVETDMTAAEYNAMPLKSASGRPWRLFYDPQYPSGVIYFNRQTDAAYTLYLDTTKPFAQFSSLSATVQLPGEYEDGITYLLIERLAPKYGFPISADTRTLIERARKLIMRKSLKPKAASFDAALTNRQAGGNVQPDGIW